MPRLLPVLSMWCAIAPVAARGGDLDAEVALDALTATSTNPGPGAGSPEATTIAELGMRVRLGLREVDDRLRVDVDYHGREPIAGAYRNDRHPLLYTAAVRFEVLPDRLTVGVGRFIAPSVVFTPVDGVHAAVDLGKGFAVEAYGGRRAITTSRRNVPLSRLLPAAGLRVARVVRKLNVELMGGWSVDEALVAGGPAQKVDADSAMARVTALPSDRVAVGGQVAFAQQAAYVMQGWDFVTFDVQSFGLWNALAWTRWEIDPDTRLSVDVQGQRMGTWRVGSDDGTGLVEDVAPAFVEERVRADRDLFDRAGIFASIRHRWRPDRNELRYGVGFDARDLEVPGLTARAELYLDDLLAPSDPRWTPAIDRLFWTAALGWHDFGVDVEAGASAVERASNPVSSRKSDPADPIGPTVSDDLAPFVLETQEVAFLRAFYGGRNLFGGLDVERNLRDGEWRVYAQVGVLGEGAVVKRLLPFAAAIGLLVAMLARADAPSAPAIPARLPGEAAAHPPGDTCASCHTDPHAGTAKVGCGECHTPERWAPSTFGLERHASVFPLMGNHTLTACTSCHTGLRLSGQPTECAGCHVDRHRGVLGADCTECHTPAGFTPVEGFDHARAGFAIGGHHAGVPCATCHEGASGDALAMGAGPACTTCHEPDHGDLGVCTDCHREAHPTFAAARSPSVFDHRETGFELHRRHAVQACGACHYPNGDRPVPRCASCHVDPHMGQLSTSCQDCHREDRWRLARFDHDLTGWALRGRHFVTPCAECHTSQRWVGLTTACWDCHAADAARAPRSVPAHGFGRTDCGDCHGQWSW